MAFLKRALYTLLSKHHPKKQILVLDDTADLVLPLFEVRLREGIDGTGGLDGVFDRRVSGGGAHTYNATSPHTTTRTTSDAFSFRSHNGGPDGKGEGWNEGQLRVFFDDVRSAVGELRAAKMRAGNAELHLRILKADSKLKIVETVKGHGEEVGEKTEAWVGGGGKVGDEQRRLYNLLPGLERILGELVEYEIVGGDPCIDRDFIVHTHVDHLLDELVRYTSSLDSKESQEAKEIGRLASLLTDLWQERLKDVGEARLTEMKTTGCARHLKRVKFEPEWELQDEVVWEVDFPSCATRAEGPLGFKPGQWWLNMYCCVRDGVVKSATEAVTHGRYGITALAMVEGTEVDGVGKGEVVYTIEGPARRMPFALLTTKQAVRVIRGSRLKSPYAPVVGVRYDGLYKIVTYSHSSIPGHKGAGMMYRDKIVLRREDDEASWEQAVRHPRPSEVDTWDLYWGGVRVQMREWLGEKRFGSWCWVNGEEEGWRGRRDGRR